MDVTWEHRYETYANKEFEWFPLDSQEAYERHLLTRRHDLEKNGWIGQSFSYKFNEHGFRSDAFGHDPGLLFLGCSFTFGTGLPLECTWPKIVSRHLDLACWNLGVAGAANDTMFRLASYWIPQLRPKIVVLLLTEPTRLEIIQGREFVPLMPRHISPPYEEFYKQWILQDANGRFNEMKNRMAIQHVCQSLGISLFIFRMRDWMFSYDKPYLDHARDLAHPGRETMAMFANKVIARITGDHQVPDQWATPHSA